MTLLAREVIERELSLLKGWRIEGLVLVHDYAFEDFRAALAFVNEVAARAEAANHHPDIDIRYNRVRLELMSHDKGGITKRDLRLAAAIDGIEHDLAS